MDKNDFEKATSGKIIIFDNGKEIELEIGLHGHMVRSLSKTLGFIPTHEGLIVYAHGTELNLSRMVPYSDIRVLWLNTEG